MRWFLRTQHELSTKNERDYLFTTLLGVHFGVCFFQQVRDSLLKPDVPLLGPTQPRLTLQLNTNSLMLGPSNGPSDYPLDHSSDDSHAKHSPDRDHRSKHDSIRLGEQLLEKLLDG